MEQKLLSVPEAAEYLGCAASTLYGKVFQGQIGYIKLWSGARKTAIRFTPELLDQHLKANTVRPKTASAGR